jgi:hypothetical protein
MFFPECRGVETHIQRLTGSVDEPRVRSESGCVPERRETNEERFQPLDRGCDTSQPRGRRAAQHCH